VGKTDIDLPSGPFHIDEQWACSGDGRRFHQVTRQFASRQDSNVSEIMIQHLELIANKLRMSDVIGKQESERWSATVPLSYLNPACDDAWPVAALQALDGPALVWLSVDTSPPMPYLIALSTATPSTTQPGEESGVELLRWPLIGMEPDRLRLDANGRIVRSDIRGRSEPAGDSVTTFRRVDRDALIAAFPSLKAKFQAIDSSELTP
jgi:hypothetical protein